MKKLGLSEGIFRTNGEKPQTDPTGLCSLFYRTVEDDEFVFLHIRYGTLYNTTGEGLAPTAKLRKKGGAVGSAFKGI